MVKLIENTETMKKEYREAVGDYLGPILLKRSPFYKLDTLDEIQMRARDIILKKAPELKEGKRKGDMLFYKWKDKILNDYK